MRAALQHRLARVICSAQLRKPSGAKPPAAGKRPSKQTRLAPAAAQPGDPLPKRMHKTDKKALAVLEKKEPPEAERDGQFVYYLGGAVLVGAAIFGFKGFQAAEEYFAGYLLEQSLSVDNLFVFLLCFNFFKTPEEYQGRVLSVGIWSAAVLRLVMILAGVELVENFKPLLLAFAAILIYSSYGLLFGEDDDEDEDLSENFIVKTINKVFTVTPDYRGDKFFVREDGILKATPLFVVLAVIEISDVIFAVDSIPAIFGVTLDPLVVYTSNMAAILSLRALYSFVATVISDLRYLDKAVAVILAFIGGKLILEQMPGGFHVPTDQSLLFVATTLGTGVAASLLFPEEKEKPAVAESENGAAPTPKQQIPEPEEECASKADKV